MMASSNTYRTKKNTVKRVKILSKTKTPNRQRLNQSKALENSRKKDCMVDGVLSFIKMDQSVLVTLAKGISMVLVQFMGLMDKRCTNKDTIIMSYIFRENFTF